VSIFRQFYLPNDDASFSKVQRVLRERAKAAGQLEAVAELERWAQAVRTTQRQSLRKSVFVKLVEEGKMHATADELAHFPDRETPKALIDRFLNTEHSHWDAEKAGALEARPDDPFRDATERFDFIGGAIGLSHLYIGHAEIARQAASIE
jgi:hypothetical protein